MKKYFGLLFFVLMACRVNGQSVSRGRTLFYENCSICHSSNMIDTLVGPPLGGVGARWSRYPIEDLFAYIKDAPAMMAAGHVRALEIDDASGMEYEMPAFPNFTDDDVAALLNYINSVYKVDAEFRKIISSNEGAFANGKKLFWDNCAACHNKNMVDRLVGPGLGGTEERWADFPKGDLYRFIRSSQEMIESGHPRAKKIWEEFRPMPMVPFPNLTDTQIKDILFYIDVMYSKAKSPSND